jgi:transcriptional regulator with XRE-family HTH domain
VERPRRGRAPTTLSTGIPSLDRLLGNLRHGDNVVWEIGGVDESPFVAAFVRAARRRPLAYVSVHVSPQAILDRFGHDWNHERFVLLDCFTDGVAKNDRRAAAFYKRPADRRRGVERVPVGSGPQALLDVLSDLERRLGRGARYVFDTLTGIQDLWGEDAALALFLRSCPRLYDLRTCAYWLVQTSAHDSGFLARLRHVTQVVLQLEEDAAGPSVRIAKTLGRQAEVSVRRARISFERDTVSVNEEPVRDGAGLGNEIQRQRAALGLSQAELARRIGISPSGLSQVERGRSGLAPATLERAREVLGLSADGEGRTPQGYRVSRRGTRTQMSVGPGMVCEELARSASHLAFFVRVAPAAKGRRTPVDTKREEFIVVLRGLLELRIGEGREVLHAGDAVLLDREMVRSWRNPGPDEAEVFWGVFLGGQ